MTMRHLCLVAAASLVLPACRNPVGDDSEGLVTRLWFAPLTSQYLWPATPAVRDGLVMVYDGRGIAAFHASDGAMQWQTELFGSEAGNAGDIVAIGDRACVADVFGGSGCVQTTSGAVVWTAPTDTPWSYQHAGDESAFYYGTHAHQVVARDPATGIMKWKMDWAPTTSFESWFRGAAVRNDTVFVATARYLNENGFESTGDLLALDRRSGRELWRFTAAGKQSDFQAGPVLAGSIAIVSDTYGHTLRAVDLATHAQLWEAVADQRGYIDAESRPVVYRDTVFAASTDTQIYALDLHTGRALWRVAGGFGSLGSTAVCGRLVLAVPWTTGPLIAVDRTTQRVAHPAVLWEGDELFSRIAVDGTTAYAVGTKGVYAFRCVE
ncbi:MAG TPA: PQQ-binding-like beta-propeller repeat protein [Gemmatimonadaceae bacterium]|nr:PQQ-binding-like beta-propeller repeat protein [Gemmatimonadaceae bacterium]